MLALLAILWSFVAAQDPTAGAGATVERFNAALEAGDSAAALALLAPGAALVVLVRGEQGWLIAAVHWSSRSRRR